MKLFPKNLMTPIDEEYMKKLVRRARQNKSKRSKTAAVRRQSGDTAPASPSAPQPVRSVSSPKAAAAPPQEAAASDEEQEEVDSSDEEEEESSGESGPTHRELDVPERGLVFPEKRFQTEDFWPVAPPGANQG